MKDVQSCSREVIQELYEGTKKTKRAAELLSYTIPRDKKYFTKGSIQDYTALCLKSRYIKMTLKIIASA